MTRTLTRLVINLGMLVNNALRPQFSLMLGAGDRQQALEFLLKIWRLTTMAGVIGYLGLVLIGPTFLQYWSGGRVLEGHWFVAMVGVHAVFGLVWHIPAALEMAENKHGHYALYYAGSALVSMAAWLVLSGLIEPVVGAALLLALPELVMVLVLLAQRVRSSHNMAFLTP
jgi:O-antigen/teichoic acid export membrane protein